MRKVHVTLLIDGFIAEHITELTVLKEHLHRACMQYKAFKQKQIEAQSQEENMTIQIYWLENAKVRQAQEEKSAYYQQDQFSIHTMRVWINHGEFFHFAMSDVFDNRAPAVFASRY